MSKTPGYATNGKWLAARLLIMLAGAATVIAFIFAAGWLLCQAWGPRCVLGVGLVLSGVVMLRSRRTLRGATKAVAVAGSGLCIVAGIVQLVG